jgi:hypothetical protein
MEPNIRSQLLSCIYVASHSLIPYQWKGEEVNWNPAIQNWLCRVAVDCTDFMAKMLGVNIFRLFIICGSTFHVIPLGVKYRTSRYTVTLFGVAQPYRVFSFLYACYRTLLLLLGLVFILLCRTYYFYVHNDFVSLIINTHPQTFDSTKYFVLMTYFLNNL